MKPIIINHFNRRKEFIEMLRERGAKCGAEVGTDRGEYAKNLCAGIPNLKLYCVDPWLAYTEGEDIHTQEEMDQIYGEAKQKLKYYDVSFYKKTSADCLRLIPDGFLDFVFIDVNHEYESVLEEVTGWTKKVKPGGIVCGHDYKEDKVRKYGVIEAINKYTEDNRVAPWFILHAGGRFNDCWMFIKQ